jgi:hypothetical protein
MLAHWVDLFLRFPEPEWGCGLEIHFAIEQMNGAVIALVDELPGNVYSELRRLLQKIEGFWGRVTKAGEGEKGLDCAAVEFSGGFLSSITFFLEPALASRPELNCWFKFGSAIGQYHLELNKVPDSTHLPTFRGVVDACRQLPGEHIRLIPEIRALASPAVRLKRGSPVPLLRRAFKEAQNPLANDITDPCMDLCTLRGALFRLDDAVQNGITRLPRLGSAPCKRKDSVSCLKPIWVKQRRDFWIGELRMGDVVAKRVRPTATRVIQLLDAFQSAGWKNPIGYPFPGQFDSQLLHETIRSTNNRLFGIRFGSDGLAKPIWKPV